MDDPLSELQALTSKRSSLRDKLKKRREALGSILAQTTENNLEDKKTSEESTSNNEEQVTAKKPKLENDNTTNESHHHHPAPRHSDPENSKKSRPKNSCNQISQFHDLFFFSPKSIIYHFKNGHKSIF